MIFEDVSGEIACWFIPGLDDIIAIIGIITIIAIIAVTAIIAIIAIIAIVFWWIWWWTVLTGLLWLSSRDFQLFKSKHTLNRYK